MVFIPPKTVQGPNFLSDQERAERVKIIENSKNSSTPQGSIIDKTEKKRQFPKGSSSNLAKNFATKKQRLEKSTHAPDFLEADGQVNVIKSSDTSTNIGNFDTKIVSQVGIGLRNKLLTSVFETDSNSQINKETKIGSSKLADIELEQARIKFMSIARNTIDYSKADSDSD